MGKEFHSDAIHALLGLIEHNRQQFNLQREVLDRWIRFCLIIVAAALAMLGAVLKGEAVNLDTPEH